MQYSVVFSSMTGNTEQIARSIRRILGEQDCVYFGSPEDATDEARKAPVVFAGSWTDRGSCTNEMGDFMASLDGRRVFVFGTCGFGASERYYNEVLGRMRENLPASCELVGSFMCQGKMSPNVRERYTKMLADAEPDSAEARRAEMLVNNFDAALAHPNTEDFKTLEADLREASL